MNNDSLQAASTNNGGVFAMATPSFTDGSQPLSPCASFKGNAVCDDVTDGDSLLEAVYAGYSAYLVAAVLGHHLWPGLWWEVYSKQA